MDEINNILHFETEELSPIRLFLKASGPLNGDNLQRLKDWTVHTAETIMRMHQKSGETISCIFDISGITEASDARIVAVLTEFQKANSPHIYRTALVVSDAKIKRTLDMSAMLANRINIKAFPTREEGEAWAYDIQGRVPASLEL